MIWGPVPWFLAASTLYFGIGPLVYSFGTPESVAHLTIFYPVNTKDLVRTNMLNMFSVCIVVFSYLLARKLIKTTQYTVPISTNRDLKWLLGVFLFLGLPVKYLIFHPYHFGQLDWTLPGSIQFISKFSALSIVILTVIAKKEKGPYRFLLYCLIILELLSAITTFSKIEVFLVIIIIIASRFYLYKNYKALFFQVMAMVALYAFVLGPFVYFGRIFYSQFGVPNLKDLSLTISQFYQSDNTLTKEYSKIQGWWTRLSYANAQTFALHAYDKDEGGDSFKLAIYALTPRFLFPEKPKITYGSIFNALVTGNSRSKSAPGFFAEAYWNGGWLYVIIACLTVGILFAIFSNVSTKYFLSNNLAILPVSFIGIRMGLQPDSWFVATYIAASIQAIFFYVLFVKLIMPLGNISYLSLRKINNQ
jgi:hypothetical protein